MKTLLIFALFSLVPTIGLMAACYNWVPYPIWIYKNRTSRSTLLPILLFFYSTVTFSITHLLFKLTFSKLLVINCTSQSIAAITYCVIITYYAGRDRIAIMLDCPWHAGHTYYAIHYSLPYHRPG